MKTTKLMWSLLFILIASSNCTKADIDDSLGKISISITSPASAGWEKVSHAGIKHGLIAEITWEGITYSQTRITPFPAVMPYQTIRNCRACDWLLIADTTKPITDSTEFAIWRRN